MEITFHAATMLVDDLLWVNREAGLGLIFSAYSTLHAGCGYDYSLVRGQVKWCISGNNQSILTIAEGNVEIKRVD